MTHDTPADDLWDPSEWAEWLAFTSPERCDTRPVVITGMRNEVYGFVWADDTTPWLLRRENGGQ